MNTGRATTSPTTLPPGHRPRVGSVTGRRAGGALAAITLLALAGCASDRDARPAPSGPAPVVAEVAAHPSIARPCLATADAVDHWSRAAGTTACVHELRDRARTTLHLHREPGSATTWVCPTTADAAEAWVRAIGVAGCRR